VGVPLTTASARPARLTRLAATVTAIGEGLRRRAGYLDDAWVDYLLTNGRDWRFEFGELPGAVRAWAETLDNIGVWTGQVGAAFLAAGGPTIGSYHLVDEDEMLSLLPCDAKAMIDATVDGRDREVDWGDPDHPPSWLDRLRTMTLAVDRTGQALDVAEIVFVVGEGADAEWHGAGPELLGRFASARAFAEFDTLFSVGSSYTAGLTAGYEQWLGDTASLNYTSHEAAERAIVRGLGTGLGAAATSGGGAMLASALCGPGAPICAGVVIVGSAFGGTTVTDWVVDKAIGSPAPAQHDPAIVEDTIDGPKPGAAVNTIPDSTWDLLDTLHDSGEVAGQADYASRNSPLLSAEIAPAVVDAYDIPASWIESARISREIVAAPGFASVRRPFGATEQAA
jgi:hypothetical protein